MTPYICRGLKAGMLIKAATLFNINPTFHERNHYIQLKCSLYGCKQAACNWFYHLTYDFIKERFSQSKIDPCLFLRSDHIHIIYKDGCIIFAKENHTIDKLIKNLSETYT